MMMISRHYAIFYLVVRIVLYIPASFSLSNLFQTHSKEHLSSCSMEEGEEVNAKNHNDDKIRVWDNVLEKSTCSKLHNIASDAGLSHRLFVRSNNSAQISKRRKTKLSYLENVLDGILKEMNDTSPYVEYWFRQEWRHIEAHSDVDEFLAKQNQGEEPFRYPKNGHVLYLEVGSKVRGPTCLFPDCSSGGDLASSFHHHQKTLVTVPAVEGRLLRFDGTLLHAVPRPPDIWLLPFVQGSMDYESKEYTRSVILFNSWREAPPLQVPEVKEEDAIKQCSEGKNDTNNNRNDVNPINLWQDRRPKISNRKENYYDRIIEEEGTRMMDKKTKIWLLGDYNRRNHTLRTVPLFSNEEELRQALHESEDPRTIQLSLQ